MPEQLDVVVVELDLPAGGEVFDDDYDLLRKSGANITRFGGRI